MIAFLSSVYLWLKAFHLLSVIAWMAGMMYLPRLFIYHFQAEKGGEAERFFAVMERRLLKGIINPAMIAAWGFAVLMIIAQPALLQAGWFLVKLGLGLGVSAVHGFYVQAQRRFEAGERPRTEKFWRVMNEAPFLMAIGIVILVIVKPF